MTAAPVVSTYSMWSLFRNCRKAVDWRYQQQLVPLQCDRNLHFGSLIHECLQAWHQRRDLDEVLVLIDKLCPNHLQDDNQRRDWHLAIAMMKAYAVQYSTEGFEVIALEKNFEGPIVNPATGAASRSFVLAGKVDGIVRIRGEHFILEHKTAAQIDSDSEAVVKLLERKCPQLRGNYDKWQLFREASVLDAGQILDVAWQVPRAHCGSRPEGLVRGEIQFRCPLGKCTADRPRARTINFTTELLARVKSHAGDIHQTVQAALEQYGRVYSRENSLKPRQQFPIVVRLKPYQHLLYSGWTPKELSDHVEFALLRLIDGT